MPKPTTPTEQSIAHAAHSLYGYARNIVTEALYDDEDPMAAAKLMREQIRAAWIKALRDTGMEEEDVRKLSFPI